MVDCFPARKFACGVVGGDDDHVDRARPQLRLGRGAVLGDRRDVQAAAGEAW